MKDDPPNNTLSHLLALARKAPERQAKETPPAALMHHVAHAWCEPVIPNRLDFVERSSWVGLGLAAAACLVLLVTENPDAPWAPSTALALETMFSDSDAFELQSFF